jgi:hypothetical protein
MNPDEMERHIMDGSRATRLRIEEVATVAKSKTVELVGGLFAANPLGQYFALTPDGAMTVGPVGPMAFEIRIPIGIQKPHLQVPYEAVTSAWVSPFGSIMVMLNVRVVWNGKDLTLLPF